MDVQAVKLKHEEALMSLPNVVGVGVGEKAGKEVIKVFVTHKVPVSALKSHEIIPETLEGVEIVVEAIGFVTAQEE